MRTNNGLISSFQRKVFRNLIFCATPAALVACAPQLASTMLQAPAAHWELQDPTAKANGDPVVPQSLISSLQPEGPVELTEEDFIGAPRDKATDKPIAANRVAMKLDAMCALQGNPYRCPSGANPDSSFTGSAARANDMISRLSKLGRTCRLGDWDGSFPGVPSFTNRPEGIRQIPELAMFKQLHDQNVLCSERWRARAARVLLEAALYPDLAATRSPAITWLRREQNSEASNSESPLNTSNATLGVDQLAMLDNGKNQSPGDATHRRDIAIRPGSLVELTLTSPLSDSQTRKPKTTSLPVTVELPIRFVPEIPEPMSGNEQWLALTFISASIGTHTLERPVCEEEDKCTWWAAFPAENAGQDKSDAEDQAPDWLNPYVHPLYLAEFAGRNKVVRRFWNSLLDESSGDLAVGVSTAWGRKFSDSSYVPETQLEARVFAALHRALGPAGAPVELATKAAFLDASRLPDGRMGLVTAPGILGEPGRDEFRLSSEGGVPSCKTEKIEKAEDFPAESCAYAANRLFGFAEAGVSPPRLSSHPGMFGVSSSRLSPIEHDVNPATVESKAPDATPAEVSATAHQKGSTAPASKDKKPEGLVTVTVTAGGRSLPGGEDLQVRVRSNWIHWGSAREMTEWSLAEWQASGVLGFVDPKIMTISWQIECRDTTVASYRPIQLTTEILWPGDTRVPSLELRLEKFAHGTDSHYPSLLLTPRDQDSEKVIFADCSEISSFTTALKKQSSSLTISYRDLRRLDAVAGLCLSLEDKACSGSANGNASARWITRPISVTYRDSLSGSTRFDVEPAAVSPAAPGPTCASARWSKDSGFSIERIDCNSRQKNKIPIMQLLPSLAMYAESVFGWDIFGAPSAAVSQRITGLDVPHIGHLSVFSHATKGCTRATHMVQLGARPWRGRLSIVPNPAAESSCKTLSLPASALWSLTASNVEALYGLSRSPLRTTTPRAQ